MNEVPIGAKCSDCGCCLAVVKAGDDFVCWECDAGEPCKGKRAPQPPPAYRAVPTRPFAAPVEEKTVTIHSSKKSTKRIPDDIRAAIISADPSISHSDLARKHGISDVTVFLIRKKAGISLVKGKRAAKPAKAAKPERRLKVATIGKREIGKLTVKIEIDENGADALWRAFTLEQKAIAIRAAFFSNLGAR
jgi:transposase-like protein